MNDFQHQQAAHCESGTVSNLISAAGLPLSEPMAFGLSSSLMFAYLPMIKLAGLPLIAYRMLPGSVMKGVSRATGVRWNERRFADADVGMAALDTALDEGAIVGLQVGIYWLPYIPEDMRFHFNAHNLVVYGRDGDDYLVSDPVLPETARCPRAALAMARFVKGAMAPKGRMYTLDTIPADIDYAHAIPAAIRRNAKLMKAPIIPVLGYSGISYLGRQIIKAGNRKDGGEYLRALLAHIVRMQEEIGTGGAGFRFIYAAFLKESGERLGRKDIAASGDAMTDIGDEWRRFALASTKMCRGRKDMDTAALARMLDDISQRERAVWEPLRNIG